MGHIELPLTVYHPCFYSKMFELLRAKCFFCHRLRGTETANQLLVAQLRLLDRGRLVDAKNLKEVIDQLLAQGDDASEDVKLRHQQLIDEQTGDVRQLPTFF